MEKDGGEFSIYNIPRGSYTLNVTAAAYRPATKPNIIIKADEQTDVMVKDGEGGVRLNYGLYEILADICKFGAIPKGS